MAFLTTVLLFTVPLLANPALKPQILPRDGPTNITAVATPVTTEPLPPMSSGPAPTSNSIPAPAPTPTPAYEPGTCRIHVVEIEACGPDSDNLSANLTLFDDGENVIGSAMAVSINANDPCESQMYCYQDLG